MVVVVGVTLMLVAVLPVFQETVPLQLLTVKVAVPPVHIVVLFTLGAGAGLGVTVTVAVAVPVPEQLPELTVQVAV